MKKSRIAFALIACAGLTLSACSKDSKDTTAATEASTEAAGTEAAPTEAGTEAAGTEALTSEATPTEAAATEAATAMMSAADRVAAFSKPVASLPFSEPVTGAAEGKKVYYVQCSVPVCEEIKGGIDAAAKKLGWTLETTAHKDTPETVAAAFDAAIAAKPDVVLTSGNPREWFEIGRAHV